MSATTMWAAMQSAIAAVAPYQGNDPTQSANYRAAVGQAMCSAIISEMNTPVAWNGTSDRVLDVGQFTHSSFTAATSMPLNIACGDGQVYEIELNGTYTQSAVTVSTILQPNNAVPATNSFSLCQLYSDNAISGGFSGVEADGGFRFDVSGGLFTGTAKVFTSTLNKAVIAHSAGGTSTNQYLSDINTRWNDTTTLYFSVGTLIFPNAWTGTVVTRRVA